MRLEHEFLQQSIDSSRNVLARLFAIALYYTREIATGNDGLNCLVNAHAVYSFVKNPSNFEADWRLLEQSASGDATQVLMLRGEKIARNARDFQNAFAREDDVFFVPLSSNVSLLSVLMSCIDVLRTNKQTSGNEKISLHYSDFVQYTCDKIESVRISHNKSAQQEFDKKTKGYQDGFEDERPNEASIRRKYKEAFEEVERNLKSRGHPYTNTTEDYKRYLFNNFKSMEIFGERVTYQDILDIFICSPIPYIDFQNAHTYIVGRSGSGKSELLKQICRKAQTNFLLIDPHGDLADEVSQNSFTRAVKRIAPHEQRFVINPFDIADKSEKNRELVAQEITDLVGELVEDSGLSRLMTTIMFPIIVTLLKLDYADFRMLSDCIHPNKGKDRLKDLRSLVDEHLKSGWGVLEGDTYDTSKQSVFNRLQSLLNYRLVAQTLCGRDDFSRAIEQSLDDRESIAVSLPIPVIGEAVAVTIGRFLATRMQIWAKRRQNIEKSKRKPVLLIMDEFHNFMSHATAETLDQFGRKFGLYMVLTHQHTAQITDREVKGAVLTNTGNKIVGVCNHDTRQTLSKEMSVSAELFEDLKAGHFVGSFVSQSAISFYSRMVQPSKPEQYQYLPSVNGTEIIDGWDGLDVEQNTPIPRNKSEPSARKIATPKFDL